MLRTSTFLVALALLVGACGGSAAAGSPGSGTSAAGIGLAFIGALARGDVAGAQAAEDPAMLAAAPGPKLGQLWQAFVAQYGDFRAIGSAMTTQQAPYTMVSVPVTFANATVTLTVTVTTSGQVAGFHVAAVAPASPAGPSASPAAYVDLASFTETPVTVGAAPWSLPGTLSMPRGGGPFPAVVIVAGSGPADRDGTYGPNEPYRDLAWGLASAGIVVLRYDKRTYVYGPQLAASVATLTVRQETTDDAVAAIALLRSTPKVDPSRVFLVGHSLGAYLAPRIAAQAPGELRGVAMLEAPSSSLPQQILAQAEYLASLGGSPSPSAESALATVRAEVALAESATLSPSTPAAELPLGIPAAYWLDLRTYAPLATAASLAIPMSFAQGGRDYQVPPSELRPWEQALAGRSDVTFTTYPAMDHELFDGSGPSTPAEYSVPSHVDAHLVADLAAWIEAH